MRVLITGASISRAAASANSRSTLVDGAPRLC